ncbi:MAG TPA: hypothetical protein VHW93_04180 [Acidimicrobiales bacterium]|nr:hypothetical protein [Acidimicrobiales bacterium]
MEGDQLESPRSVPTSEGQPPIPPPPPAFQLEGLVLCDGARPEPVTVDSIIFSDDGIGVVRYRGEQPRYLPWTSVTAHVVERWVGGAIPPGWVDQNQNGVDPGPPAPVRRTARTRRRRRGRGRGTAGTPTTGTGAPVARVGTGALIGIRTPYGSYRFLFPGGDPADVSRRVAAFAVRHHGPTGASTVTRVVAWGEDIERRQSVRPAPVRAGWYRVRPILTVLLVVFIGLVVALILLQSAGTIHLPVLGGSGQQSLPALRTR